MNERGFKTLCIEKDGHTPVSYTHLDVYKRQTVHKAARQKSIDFLLHFSKLLYILVT